MRGRIGRLLAVTLFSIALLTVPATSHALDQVPYLDLTPKGGESRAVAVASDGVVLGNTGPAPESSVWRAPDYTAQSLGPLGPHAEAVNNAGDAVGCTANGVGLYWHDGTITYLERPGRTTCLYAINDAGQIAGASATPTGSEQAFVWEDGRFTDLGAPADRASAPIAINNRGQILGRTFGTTKSVPMRAFVWEDGRFTDLGSLGGPQTIPTALAEDGSVGGTSSVDAKTAHPFRWAGGTMTDLLAGSGVTDPEATVAALNANGDVVGTVSGRPVLWHGGKMSFLADAGEATAVNADGVVTGVVRSGDTPTVFRWRDGGLVLLRNPAGATYCYATGITADGRVVGNVSIGETNHAVVWL
ncbi:hypothetical protein [Cryptosporangium arvum]|uniref:hypothetical protein n=1 Tax=Cryptosporangium arvum TaxID=80871 RepID=UPI0004B97427|nr:hypothetical protein [Cryptosporangium arvum]